MVQVSKGLCNVKKNGVQEKCKISRFLIYDELILSFKWFSEMIYGVIMM